VGYGLPCKPVKFKWIHISDFATRWRLAGESSFEIATCPEDDELNSGGVSLAVACRFHKEETPWGGGVSGEEPSGGNQFVDLAFGICVSQICSSIWNRGDGSHSTALSTS
jgi:hypothetical protein